MRVLNKKQKTLLTKWHKENGVKNVNELTDEQWDTLEKINDNEVLSQNTNRFLIDMTMKELSESDW